MDNSVLKRTLLLTLSSDGGMNNYTKKT